MGFWSPSPAPLLPSFSTVESELQKALAECFTLTFSSSFPAHEPRTGDRLGIDCHILWSVTDLAQTNLLHHYSQLLVLILETWDTIKSWSPLKSSQQDVKLAQSLWFPCPIHQLNPCRAPSKCSSLIVEVKVNVIPLDSLSEKWLKY